MKIHSNVDHEKIANFTQWFPSIFFTNFCTTQYFDDESTNTQIGGVGQCNDCRAINRPESLLVGG